MKADLPVVILAGGEGSRIGGGKPLRMLAGRSLIARALDRARTWSDEVAIAVRDGTRLDEAPIIIDDPEIPGPLSGLAAALHFAREAGAEHVLVIACDLPFLPDELPQRLGGAIGHAGAAIATSKGERHTTCALWRSDALDRLEAYLAGPRRSLKGFAEEIGFVAVEWADEPLDPFFNVNSETDLARAEALLAG